MSIEYAPEAATLRDIVTVDDAETLLQWLQSHDARRVDLSECTHIHAASLQVLMAAGVTVTAWPTDPALDRWLRSAISLH